MSNYEDRRQATNPFNVPEYRAEFNEALDRHRSEINTTLGTTIAPIAKLVAAQQVDIAALKAAQQRQKGAATVLGILWAALLASLEFFFHRK